MSQTRFLCGFQENKLYVNPVECTAALRHQAQLHLILAAAGAPVALCARPNVDARPAIRLTVTLGESGTAMLTPTDARTGCGTVTAPGFFVQESWGRSPQSKSRLTCKLVAEEDLNGVLDDNHQLCLVWSGICSTAPEGICTVTVELTGIQGMENGTYFCELLKLQAPLQIKAFQAEPSTGAAGDCVKLKWDLENADEGYILPGGYDIFQQGPQTTSYQEVVLDRRVDRYYLYVANPCNSAYQLASVFTSVPVIEKFELLDGQLSWVTHFTQSIELSQGGGPFQPVERTGSQPVEKGAGSATLRCRGDGVVVERRLCLSRLAELRLFAMTVHTFRAHCTVKVEWETQDLKQVGLMLWDTVMYPVSTLARGSWEQAFGRENVSIGLVYTLSSGASGMEVFPIEPSVD